MDQVTEKLGFNPFPVCSILKLIHNSSIAEVLDQDNISTCVLIQQDSRGRAVVMPKIYFYTIFELFMCLRLIWVFSYVHNSKFPVKSEVRQVFSPVQHSSSRFQ